jgi:hypothetical protein
MSHRQTRLERIAEGSFPYWICLPEEKCIGANFQKHREFCRAHGLTLSKHGHSIVWEKEWYQVFRFAEAEHAARFIKEFGGERMHPSERGKGKRWAQWKKGTYKPKARKSDIDAILYRGVGQAARRLQIINSKGFYQELQLTNTAFKQSDIAALVSLLRKNNPSIQLDEDAEALMKKYACRG